MPLLYRAHFATIGKNFGTTTGIDTRTTLVFFNYIFQVLTEEKPDGIAGALDSKPKGRVAVSSTYKANRDKMPSEISSAFPYAIRLLEALGIPVLKEEGSEADDVIAALAKRGEADGYAVFIVSPDKDFAQLVNEQIFLFRPAYKGATMETLDVEGVKSKYGVAPNQIADFLALRGDSVDNIVGVKGIGDKTAAQLLEEFHSIEQLLEQVESIKQPKLKESIAEAKEQLIENKQLAVLSGDLHVSIEWQDIKARKPDETLLLPLLEELQFAKIRERLAKQGFITDEINPTDKVESANVVIVPLTPEALAKQETGKEIAIGFSEQQVDRLFIITPESKSINEIILTNDSDWISVIRLLDDNAARIVGWQLKPLLKIISRLGIQLKTPWIDVSLAAYLLQPDAKIEWSLIKDKYQLNEYHVDQPLSHLNYLPSVMEAYEKIIVKISDLNLSRLLFEIELPLQSAITTMESHGIALDLNALKEIDKVLTKQLNDLEQKLYENAGMKFNINSPSKTAEILQGICEPSELKKTKTGQISTAEPFLADLAPKYPFIAIYSITES
jgi:DNA polymerase-1